jgi:hypothetical protein
VTKTHYINPRYYKNERTILLNPSKPFSKVRKRQRKSSFVRTLLFVLILFSVFIGYTAFADVTDKSMPDEGWVTEVFEDTITVKHHGNVTHGDDIVYIFNKSDCSQAAWVGKIYTEAQNDFSPIIEKLLPFKLTDSINEYHEYTTGHLFSVKPFLRGQSALIYFGKYPVDSYLQWHRNGAEYHMEIIQADKKFIADKFKGSEEHVVSIVPTSFFDIPINSYYYKGFSKAMLAAQKQCEDIGIVTHSRKRII